MNKNIAKLAKVTLTATTLASLISGCVGNNVVTNRIMQFNYEVVDNHYARGGVNMLLIPVYALSVTVDIVIFNSIGFWTGQSPLNNKPYIFEGKSAPNIAPTSTTPENTKAEPPTNPDIFPTHDIPAASISNIDFDALSSRQNTNNHSDSNKKVYSMQAQAINANTVDYYIVYENGETSILRSEKVGEVASFYLNGELISTATLSELKAYIAPKVAQL